MPIFRIVLCACILSILIHVPARAGGAKVVFDKTFKVLPPENDTEIGTYTLRASEEGSKLVLTEKFSLSLKGTRYDLETDVTYQTAPEILPLSGKAQTMMDGKPVMTGSVEFKGETFSFSGELVRNKRGPLDPPRKFKRVDQKTPKGFVMFQSAVMVLGPRLLKKPGEVKEFVFVEFPDDIDELIHLKTIYKLIRKDLEDPGKFLIMVGGDAPLLVARFNKTELEGPVTFSKFRMVEERAKGGKSR